MQSCVCQHLTTSALKTFFDSERKSPAGVELATQVTTVPRTTQLAPRAKVRLNDVDVYGL